MRSRKSILYLSLAAGMLIYAVPRLTFVEGWTLPVIFSASWIGFALLVIAAHLHQLLGVDKETAKELERVRRMKKWKMQQLVLGRKKMLHFKRRSIRS